MILFSAAAPLCALLAAASAEVPPGASPDVSPDAAPASPPDEPPFNTRGAALARALREPLGSPDFYRALRRPDLAHAGENRILGRQVMTVSGVALGAVGFIGVLYSMRDYKLGLAGNGKIDEGFAGPAVAVLATGGMLFLCGSLLRPDPLPPEERDELIRDFRAGRASADLVTRYGFLVPGGGGVGLSGRF